MRATKLWMFSMVLGFCMLLLGCGGNNHEEPSKPPAILEKVPGTTFNRVILTKESVDRIGLQTVPLQLFTQPIVMQTGIPNPTQTAPIQNASQKFTVPYSAIIYGLQGESWVYIQIKPLVFMRFAVAIDHIEGDAAILTTAPPLNTQVVSVGASELYGSEYIGNIEP